ncbi:MAG: hypothetical protein RI571_12190 [Roseovarius sp.]|nr:hypothetical protein [Roseovarius sp.]
MVSARDTDQTLAARLVTSLQAALGSYAPDPATAIAADADGAVQGLSVVDLSAYLPTDTRDRITPAGVFEGGTRFVSDIALEHPDVPALAADLGLAAGPAALQAATVFMDRQPAEAVALRGDGSGLAGRGTLYLGLRGSDNLVDAALGGQAWTGAGQAAYFRMLAPFFEAARAYAAAQGIERIVVTGHSLGGAMADLFAVLVAPRWRRDFEVESVSLGSPGLAPDVLTALAAPDADPPVSGSDGPVGRPVGHLDLVNLGDPVPFPATLPDYAPARLLADNTPLAGAVRFDQVAVDGGAADVTGPLFGPAHDPFLYAEAARAFAVAHPEAQAMADLAGKAAIVGAAEGDDFLAARGAATVVLGLGGADTLRGGADPDHLLGGAETDIAGGAVGDDTIKGDGGHDSLGGGPGRDRIMAGAGDDAVGGGLGNDRIDGGVGDDFLAGGGRDDTLDGGDGDDRLNAGPGNDVLTGGPGADVFVFRAHGGCERDVVTDFDPARDKVLLDAAAIPALHATAAGTRLSLPDRDLLLLDMSPGELGAGDFLLTGG